MAKKQKPPCSVEGCDRISKGRGLCMTHYQRLRRSGSVEPRPPGMPVRVKSERLQWVDRVMQTPREECVPWPFKPHPSGYGIVTYEGKAVRVHRLILTLTVGDPPNPKHQARHLCGNSLCCNPKHLAWGTAKQNSDDKILHGTEPKGEIHGHSKLTAREVINIKHRLEAGESVRQIARSYGVSEGAVRRIKNGKSWAWLDAVSVKSPLVNETDEFREIGRAGAAASVHAAIMRALASAAEAMLHSRTAELHYYDRAIKRVRMDLREAFALTEKDGDGSNVVQLSRRRNDRFLR